MQLICYIIQEELVVHFFRVWQDSQGGDIKNIVNDTIKKYRDAGIKAYISFK